MPYSAISKCCWGSNSVIREIQIRVIFLFCGKSSSIKIIPSDLKFIQSRSTVCLLQCNVPLHKVYGTNRPNQLHCKPIFTQFHLKICCMLQRYIHIFKAQRGSGNLTRLRRAHPELGFLYPEVPMDLYKMNIYTMAVYNKHDHG